MARYLLHHRHEPGHCGVAYAAFRGHPSSLRRKRAVASCLSGGHEIWWLIDANSPEEALHQLPHFLAARTTATQITKVHIP